MARLPRRIIPGFPHHVTQRGVRSIPVFRHDDDRKSYIHHLAQQSERHDLEILAWCLMPNHIHIVALPREQESLARGIGEAHRRYTREINFSEGVRGHLFQERFHSCALDEMHLLAAVRYIELNPVKAHMVARAEEWIWSSARFHMGLVAEDPLVKDTSLMGLIAPGKWGEYLTQENEIKDEELLSSVRTGRPAGSSAFIQKLEELSGQRFARKSPGRPKQKVMAEK